MNKSSKETAAPSKVEPILGAAASSETTIREEATNGTTESSALTDAEREKAAQRVTEAKEALEAAKRLESAATRAANAQASRDLAAQFMKEQRYDEAKKSLKEAEDIEAQTAGEDRLTQVKAARDRAAQLMSEHRYAEARAALDEADQLEAAAAGWKDGPRRLFTAIRSRIPARPKQASEAAAKTATSVVIDPVEKSVRTVNLYSKIAAAVGLLPGGLLNFAAILAVQIVMVFRISLTFGHKESKEQIRGAILSLFGSVLPAGIGHSAGLAIASIPAVIAGTVVYFVATPILAYALTRAVGNVFIMHFESGGTLLTFDPKAFGEYFLGEFQKAGGIIKKESEPATAVAQPA